MAGAQIEIFSNLLIEDYKILSKNEKSEEVPADYVTNFNEKCTSFLNKFPSDRHFQKNVVLAMAKAMKRKHKTGETVLGLSGNVNNTVFNEITSISTKTLQAQYPNLNFNDLTTIKRQYEELRSAEISQVKSEKNIKNQIIDFKDIQQKRAFFSNMAERFSHVEYGSKEHFDLMVEYLGKDFETCSIEEKVVLVAFMDLHNEYQKFSANELESSPDMSEDEILKKFFSSYPSEDQEELRNQFIIFMKKLQLDEIQKNLKDLKRNVTRKRTAEEDPELIANLEAKAEQLKNELKNSGGEIKKIIGSDIFKKTYRRLQGSYFELHSNEARKIDDYIQTVVNKPINSKDQAKKLYAIAQREDDTEMDSSLDMCTLYDEDMSYLASEESISVNPITDEEVLDDAEENEKTENDSNKKNLSDIIKNRITQILRQTKEHKVFKCTRK